MLFLTKCGQYHNGGYRAAGIGGGFKGNGIDIKISDRAKVNAKGGSLTAGIGGGYVGSGENIEIFGNARVNATGNAGAAGIGGGRGGNGENIEISGSAIVNATGSNGAAGIGSGGAGNGSNITISGNPTIQVTSGEDGFGFGNSLGKSQITISGGTIKTLNCIPFSDMPDLINTNCDVLSNGKICENRRDDTYTSYADRFEIIPGA